MLVYIKQIYNQRQQKTEILPFPLPTTKTPEDDPIYRIFSEKKSLNIERV